MRFKSLMLSLLALAIAATPALSQGKGKGPKHYKVKADNAIVITREVLVKQGFLVERVDDKDGVITVWYYRGNMGQGRGKGPLEKMVIRRVREELVFEAPAAIMIYIDVRLKL